ncbi:hypothetical protein D3C87_1001770 [compost metagenome]
MAAANNVPRGIRNHNPGNLDRNAANKWQGLAADQSSDPRFCVFTDPTWGIRALTVLLINYQDKYGIRTIKDIINRWAPGHENDTDAYVLMVSKQTGLSPNVRLELHDYQFMEPVVQAIIRHENGRGPLSTPNTWYGQDVIDAALSRAGIVKKASTVAKVPVTRETVAATSVATVGVAQLADVAPQVMAAMDKAQDNLSSGSVVRIVLGVLTIAFAAYIAWSQVKKHKIGVIE